MIAYFCPFENSFDQLELSATYLSIELMQAMISFFVLPSLIYSSSTLAFLCVVFRFKICCESV